MCVTMLVGENEKGGPDEERGRVERGEVEWGEDGTWRKVVVGVKEIGKIIAYSGIMLPASHKGVGPIAHL